MNPIVETALRLETTKNPRFVSLEYLIVKMRFQKHIAHLRGDIR